MKNTRIKRSIIRIIEKETLQKIFNTASSLKEVLTQIGVKPSCGNYKTLNVRMDEDQFDLKIFHENIKIREKNHGLSTTIRRSNDEIFIENSKHTDRKTLKNRMLSLGIEYKCCECGINNYNNMPISLQLDHINGINNDNRITNLRLLCPNCHSQTPTFAGRKHKKYKTCSCGHEIKTKSMMCRRCNNQNKNTKIVWPTPSELQKMIWERSTSSIAKDLGVSDTAIKIFCRKNNINKPPRGYWSKNR